MLSTPARLGDNLLAKGIFGTLIAFSETVIILLLIRALGTAPVLVLFTVLLGAVLVTAVAMVAGSTGKDLMGTMLLGILILIPLAIPALAHWC